MSFPADVPEVSEPEYDTIPGKDTAVYPQPGAPPDIPKPSMPVVIDRSWWPILALGCVVIVVVVFLFQEQIDN